MLPISFFHPVRLLLIISFDQEPKRRHLGVFAERSLRSISLVSWPQKGLLKQLALEKQLLKWSPVTGLCNSKKLKWYQSSRPAVLYGTTKGQYTGSFMRENLIYEPSKLLYLEIRMDIGICRVKELPSPQITSLYWDIMWRSRSRPEWVLTVVWEAWLNGTTIAWITISPFCIPVHQRGCASMCMCGCVW